MMRRLLTFTFLPLAVLATGYLAFHTKATNKAAQTGLANTSVKPARTLTLPAFDLVALNKEAALLDQEKGPYRFAKAHVVNADSSTLGQWSSDGVTATWRLDVVADGARSLNFGFSEYSLPPGATLTLAAPGGEPVARFSEQDNAQHGELWTPIVQGSAARLILTVAEKARPLVALKLFTANFGFRQKNKIVSSSDISKSCNIDVVCGSRDYSFSPLINFYENQIRSVGAYTLSGTDTCTGVLVNNTARDRRPFFLTADHCKVRDDNAASVVVYWNFENLNCRPPESLNSGDQGSGETRIFNSGAFFRARSEASDFCLLELDSPVNPDANAYFAGWDRSSSRARSTAGIHHPAVGEKRISFDFDSPSEGTFFSQPETRFWRVVSWDVGTTEPGSSGSPLFDGNGRVIGQLAGGSASCSFDGSDFYGKFSESWSGSSSSAQSLVSWLGPAGSPSSIDGIEATPAVTFLATDAVEGSPSTVTLTSNTTFPTARTFEITLIGGTASASDLASTPTTITLPAGTLAVSHPLPTLLDSITEPDETARIRLTSSDSIRIRQSTAEFLIFDSSFDRPGVLVTNVSTPPYQPFTSQATITNRPTSISLTNAPDGLTVNTNGQLSWPNPIPGTYSPGIVATNPAGSATSGFTLTVTPDEREAALDLSSGKARILSQSSEFWRVSPSGAATGPTTVSLDPLNGAPSEALVIEVTGPDVLIFDTSITSSSSTPSFRLGTLSVRMDGDVCLTSNDLGAFQSTEIDIPEGTHELRFTFERSVEAPEATLDNFRFKSSGPLPPYFLSHTTHYVLRDKPFVIGLSPKAADTVTATSAGDTEFSGETGIISGTLRNRRTIAVTATNDVGTTTREFAVEMLPSTSGFDAAVDLPGLAISGSQWIRTTAERQRGSAALGSAPIEDEGTATLITQLVGPGKLSFQWRVSSELYYDGLIFLQDGVRVGSITGEQPWRTVEIDLRPGLNELTWVYLKNSSMSAGSDAGFVDDIQVSGYAAWVLDSENAAVSLTAYPQEDTDGDGLSAFFEYATGGSPSSQDHFLPGLSLASDGSARLTAEIDSNASNVAYSLQTSNTLNGFDWKDMPHSESDGTLSSQASRVEKAFFRLKAVPDLKP